MAKSKTPTATKVVAFVKKNRSLLEYEVVNTLGCSRNDVREARRMLGIDRTTAVAAVVKALKRRPAAPAAEMIEMVAKKYGVKLDPPDVSRARKVALAS